MTSKQNAVVFAAFAVVFALIASSSVTALSVSNFNLSYEYNYQENASSFSCVGSFLGGQPCSYAYDADWDTWTRGDAQAYVYMNYTQPPTATTSSKWQVKGWDETTNVTPSLLCFDQAPLQLRVQSSSVDAVVWYSAWSCWDNSKWVVLNNQSLASSTAYEEAMWWQLQATAENITMTANTNYTRYIKVKKLERVTNATLRIRGYTWSNTTNLTSNADTYIEDGVNSGVNFGTSTVMDVQGERTGSVINHALLRFNVSTLPKEATINSANLSMYMSSATLVNTANVSVHHVTGFWNETNSSFDDGVPTHKGVADDNITIVCGDINCDDGEDVWYYWDVNYSVDTQVKQGNFSVDLIVKSDSSYNRRFDSRESANDPWLYVTYTSSYPGNLTVDSGNDGGVDHTNVSKLKVQTLVDLNITAINNYISSCSEDSDGYCYVPIVFASKYTGILEYNGLNVNTVPYKQNYSARVFEKDVERFELLLNLSAYDNSSASFFLNGSTHTPTRTVNGGAVNFAVSTRMGWMNGTTAANLSSWWTYRVNYSTGESVVENTSRFQQTLYQIRIDNCSLTNVTALNFSLMYESNISAARGDMAATFFVWHGDSDYRKSYSFDVEDKKNMYVCVNPGWATYNTDAQLEYSASGSSVHSYNLFNNTLDSETDSIFLYLTNGTTSVIFTVSDENDDIIEDVYIKVMKYDVGSNTYKTIEVLKTDYLGKAIGQIVLNSVWYKFILEYQGQIVLETSPVKITGTSRAFRISLGDDYFTNYNVVRGIHSNLVFTNTTNNFAYTYSDTTNTIHYGCLEVVVRGAKSDVLINKTCVQSAAATILINIGSDYEGKKYVATGYVLFDEKIVTDQLFKDFKALLALFKDEGEGFFWGFLLSLTLVMVGVFSPIVAVLLLLVSYVAMYMLEIVVVQWTYLATLIILGGITMYKLSRK